MSRMDATAKREAWNRLKELAGQGRIVPEKRKGFTGKERAQIHADYDGRCRACDRLVGLRFECDHRVPLFRGGKHVRANWELLCTDCHKAKTGGEAAGNAKCRRIEKREVEGPDAPQIKSRNEWPNGQKLPSRKFAPGKRALSSSARHVARRSVGT